MTQSDFGTIDANVNNGTQLASMLNNWRNAVHTLHSGAARPSYVQPGTLWVDTSGGATNWLLKMYLSAGAGDRTLATINSTTGTWSWQGDGSLLTGLPIASSVQSPPFPSNLLLTNTANFFNGPNTGSIGAAGQKWYIDAYGCFTSSSADYFTMQIWNGAAAVGPTTDLTVLGIANGGVLCRTNALVTLSGPTTFTLQAKDNSTVNGMLIGGTAAISALRLT